MLQSGGHIDGIQDSHHHHHLSLGPASIDEHDESDSPQGVDRKPEVGYIDSDQDSRLDALLNSDY